MYINCESFRILSKPLGRIDIFSRSFKSLTESLCSICSSRCCKCSCSFARRAVVVVFSDLSIGFETLKYLGCPGNIEGIAVLFKIFFVVSPCLLFLLVWLLSQEIVVKSSGWKWREHTREFFVITKFSRLIARSHVDALSWFEGKRCKEIAVEEASYPDRQHGTLHLFTIITVGVGRESVKNLAVRK